MRCQVRARGRTRTKRSTWATVWKGRECGGRRARGCGAPTPGSVRVGDRARHRGTHTHPGNVGGDREGRGWSAGWVRVVLADASLVKPREPAAFGMRQGTTRRDAPRSSRAADSRVALTSTPMKLLSMGWSLAFMSRVTAWRVRAGAVGGAREAMTRAEWDKVALTPRIDFDSCQWAGHPGLRGMAGPRRRISRRVLPLLLIIGVLGLGSRVLGPHPGGGVDGDGAATTADPGSHHRSSASNDENLGGAVVVGEAGCERRHGPRRCLRLAATAATPTRSVKTATLSGPPTGGRRGPRTRHEEG